MTFAGVALASVAIGAYTSGVVGRRIRRWSVVLGGVLASACVGTSGSPAGADASTGEEDTEAATTGAATEPTTTAGTGGDEASTGEPDADPPPWVYGWPIPGEPPVPGDPVAGYEALVTRGYVACGIPLALWPLAAPGLGSFADGEPLPDRTGANADMPHNWTVHTAADGAEIVSLNCLECHAGRIGGELVVGLGKADVDYTTNFGDTLGGLTVPEVPLPGLAQLTEMIQRYQAVGDQITMYTVGTNPADKLAIVLGSHRDAQTLAWNDTPSYPVPDVVVPVDTPPWWRTAKKHGLFYNGMARGDHRGTMLFATSLCTDDVAEAEVALEYFDDVAAYIRSIEPPPYPGPIDEGLAEQGHGLFLTDCAGCHGTYDADPDNEAYPNLLLPLDVVGTDPLIAEQSAEQPFADWFNETWYGAITPLSPAEPFPGYVAPPLDGIWATAPFFHNASVPNLDLVLDSTRRPTYWRRIDYDSTHFDDNNVGWPYLELDTSWDDTDPAERKYVYDTTKLGHWNTGHDFGDHYTPSERAAVIEYLKTL